MLPGETHTIVIVPGLRGHVEDHWQLGTPDELAASSPSTVTVADRGDAPPARRNVR
jgi:hypothetical protein